MRTFVVDRNRVIKTLLTCAIFFVPLITAKAQPDFKTKVEKEYFATLKVLSEALLRLQNTDKTSDEYGGILDPENDIYYTRAAEALYPFTMLYKYTNDKKYLRSAIDLGNWLITKQETTGEWIENPWAWTGTTADQLLMMASDSLVFNMFFQSILNPLIPDVFPMGLPLITYLRCS